MEFIVSISIMSLISFFLGYISTRYPKTRFFILISLGIVLIILTFLILSDQFPHKFIWYEAVTYFFAGNLPGMLGGIFGRKQLEKNKQKVEQERRLDNLFNAQLIAINNGDNAEIERLRDEMTKIRESSGSPQNLLENELNKLILFYIKLKKTCFYIRFS